MCMWIIIFDLSAIGMLKVESARIITGRAAHILVLVTLVLKRHPNYDTYNFKL